MADGLFLMYRRKIMLPIRILYLYSTCELFVDIITGYVDIPFIQFGTAHPSALKIGQFSELDGIENTRLYNHIIIRNCFFLLRGDLICRRVNL
jgi:hypothetical protein